MDIFNILLLLSGTSILVTLFLIITFVGSLPALAIFKTQGNEKIAFTFGVLVAVLLCQTTFNSYLDLLGEFKVVGILVLIVFFFVFLIPFVAYGFPDFSFPGRAFLFGGALLSLLIILDIELLSINFQHYLSINLLLYISVAWSTWNLLAFILNPQRRKRVFNNVFKGELSHYVPGDFG